MADMPELPPPMVPAQRRTGVDGRLLPEALSHEQKMTAWFRKLVESVSTALDGIGTTLSAIAAWQAPRGAIVKCGGGAYASGATVNFGYTFSSPPRVVVTHRGTDTSSYIIASVQNITTTGFQLNHPQGATLVVYNWIAVQG